MCSVNQISPIAGSKAISDTFGIPHQMLMPGKNIVTKTEPSMIAFAEGERREEKRRQARVAEQQRGDAARQEQWSNYFSATNRNSNRSLLY